MASLNRCDFIGRLGADPEKRTTQSGKTVTNFRIAVSDKRGGNESTEWVSVVCWEQTANFVGDYMRKGQLAFVSGRMQTRQWQDKDGQTKYTTEIIANTVQNLSPRSDHGNSDHGYSGPPEPPTGTGEDVPF